MKTFTIILTLPLFICVSPAPVHAPTEREVIALRTLLHEDWSKMVPASIEKIWTRELKRDETSDAGCDGTVMLSNMPMGKDDCSSCDTFLFDRVHTEGAGCTERLSALTLLRSYASVNAAVDFGEQLKKLVSGNSPESQTVPYEHGYTIVSWPSPTVSQTARYDIEDVGDHVRARLLIFRTEMTPK